MNPKPIAQLAQRALRISWRWIREHRWLAIALILAGVGLQVFGELADELLEGTLFPVDRLILDLLQLIESDLLINIAFVFSELLLLPWVVIIGAPFAIYLAWTRRHRALKVFLAVPLGTVAMMWLVKLIFARARPETAAYQEIGHSFPSGHAMGAVVFYGLLGYIAWRFMTTRTWARVVIALVTLILIVGTGLARVYLHVHYPSDVLAGWAAGLFILSGSLIALETWPRPRR